LNSPSKKVLCAERNREEKRQRKKFFRSWGTPQKRDVGGKKKEESDPPACKEEKNQRRDSWKPGGEEIQRKMKLTEPGGPWGGGGENIATSETRD